MHLPCTRAPPRQGGSAVAQPAVPPASRCALQQCSAALAPPPAWNATTAAELSLPGLGPGRARRAGRPRASATTRCSGAWEAKGGRAPRLRRAGAQVGAGVTCLETRQLHGAAKNSCTPLRLTACAAAPPAPRQTAPRRRRACCLRQTAPLGRRRRGGGKRPAGGGGRQSGQRQGVSAAGAKRSRSAGGSGRRMARARAAACPRLDRRVSHGRSERRWQAAPLAGLLPTGAACHRTEAAESARHVPRETACSCSCAAWPTKHTHARAPATSAARTPAALPGTGPGTAEAAAAQAVPLPTRFKKPTTD